MLKFILVLSFISMFAASCGPEYAKPARSKASMTRERLQPLVENTHWILTTVNGRPAIEDGSVRQGYLQLKPDDLGFHAGTGINGISGTYSLNGRSLRFTLGISTKMAGSDDAMVQERDLLQALAATQTYRIDGRELQLKVDDQVIALFVAQ